MAEIYVGQRQESTVWQPRPTDPGVRFFVPGIHRPGKIVLQSHERVYLAGVAVTGALAYGLRAVLLGR